MSYQTINNVHIVTPDRIIENGDLHIEDDRIAVLGGNLGNPSDSPPSASHPDGLYALPGIIDLHTDALEKEITPRPGADFPIEIALQELEARLLCCGVTTVYHSVHMGYKDSEDNSRSRIQRKDIFYGTLRFSQTRSLIRTRLHLRLEITGLYALPLVKEFLENEIIHLISFMDHTPGQGQYSRERFLLDCAKKGLTVEVAEEMLRERQNRPKLSDEEIKALVAQAERQGMAIASHDDDSAEKVKYMKELGVEICEFPITLEAARTANELGMSTFGGASNLLRGGSLTGNLSMQEAIENNALDGFCSDYYPPSILHAVFKLWRSELRTLPEAVNMATLLPARAGKIAHYTGSLEIGKMADIILVRVRDGQPKVESVFVEGKLVYQSATRNYTPSFANDSPLEEPTATV